MLRTISVSCESVTIVKKIFLASYVSNCRISSNDVGTFLHLLDIEEQPVCVTGHFVFTNHIRHYFLER